MISGYPYYYRSDSAGDVPQWLTDLLSQADEQQSTVAATVPEIPQSISGLGDLSGEQQQASASTAAAAETTSPTAPTSTSATKVTLPTSVTNTTATRGPDEVLYAPRTPGATLPPLAFANNWQGQAAQTAGTPDNPYMGISLFALQHSYDTNNPLVAAAIEAKLHPTVAPPPVSLATLQSRVTLPNKLLPQDNSSAIS